MKHRIVAAGLAAVLMLTATPVYASADLITLLPFPIEHSENEDTRVLTLEEAFRMAQRNNSSIDTLNDTITFIEQQRRSLVIDELNAWRFGAGLLDHSAAQLGRAIRSIDVTQTNAPTTQQTLESLSSFLVLNNVNMIYAIELDLVFERETVAFNAVTLQHTELRNELGLASDADVTDARRELESSRAALRAMEITLESLNVSLNHLIGLPSATNVRVKHHPQLDIGRISDRVRNINHYADRQTHMDPTIETLRRQVRDAQFNYNSWQDWVQNWAPSQPGVAMNWETNITDRASMLNALNAAGRELTDSIDNMQENIRQAYMQLRQLEEQREILLITLQRAHDAYATASVNLTAGMVTQHQVESARLAIMMAEGLLIGNSIAYENLLFRFERPFLLAI